MIRRSIHTNFVSQGINKLLFARPAVFCRRDTYVSGHLMWVPNKWGVYFGTEIKCLTRGITAAKFFFCETGGGEKYVFIIAPNRDFLGISLRTALSNLQRGRSKKTPGLGRRFVIIHKRGSLTPTKPCV